MFIRSYPQLELVQPSKYSKVFMLVETLGNGHQELDAVIYIKASVGANGNYPTGFPRAQTLPKWVNALLLGPQVPYSC